MTLQQPSEYPECAAEMRRRGIVHKPGMAAEMLQELAPLLRAEGIDLDDPHADFDIDQLNAAFAQATAQRNLPMLTLVGKHRELALAALRATALLIAEGRQAEAESALDSFAPDPTPTAPSAGHLLGTAIGLLDTQLSSRQIGNLIG